MEIAFAAVKALGISIELYISASEEGPSQAPPPIYRETVPSHGGCHEVGTPYEGACDSDNTEAVQGQVLST